MPYIGGRLEDLVSEAAIAITQETARGMAAKDGRAMTDWVALLTPTDTGVTAASWAPLPVTRRRVVNGIDAYRSGTASASPVAKYLDAGVRPHTIKPRDAEAITTPEGPRGEVEHPGFKPGFMTAKAAARLDVDFPRVLASDARDWARKVEAAAKRHPGIR